MGIVNTSAESNLKAPNHTQKTQREMLYLRDTTSRGTWTFLRITLAAVGSPVALDNVRVDEFHLPSDLRNLFGHRSSRYI